MSDSISNDNNDSDHVNSINSRYTTNEHTIIVTSISAEVDLGRAPRLLY